MVFHCDLILYNYRIMENEKATQNSLGIERSQVKKSVHALLEYVKKTAPADFLDEPYLIQLQLCFKLVHTKSMTIRIHLPVTFASKTTDICLFVKDLDRKNEEADDTILHYKELFEKYEIGNITEIIPMRKLKNEYGPHEAKRNLARMFDVYLADERIMRLLPERLGKVFYSRGRIPLQVNMRGAELKKHIDDAISSTNCVLKGRGSQCQANVAHTAMSEDLIIENVVAAAKRLAETVPGGAANIRNLHIKTPNSVAIPVYVSMTSATGVELPKPAPEPLLDEPEDVTPITAGKVRVTPDGRIQIIPFESGKEEQDEAGDTSTGVMKNRQTDDTAEEETASVQQFKRKRMDEGTEDEEDDDEEDQMTKGKKMQKNNARRKGVAKSPVNDKTKQRKASRVESMSSNDANEKERGKKRKLVDVTTPKGKKQHVDKRSKNPKPAVLQKKVQAAKSPDQKVVDKKSKNTKPGQLLKKVKGAKNDKLQTTGKKSKNPGEVQDKKPARTSNVETSVKTQKVGKNAKNVATQNLANTKSSRTASVKAPKKKMMAMK